MVHVALLVAVEVLLMHVLMLVVSTAAMMNQTGHGILLTDAYHLITFVMDGMIA